MESLLIANRGEVAIRVARAAAELGVRTVAVYAPEDARCLHVKRADRAIPLPGRGAAAYLDVEALLSIAQDAGCDALHPGYGFLSESAELAVHCQAQGVVFVGPPPDALRLFGDKARARGLARRCGVPCLPGTECATTLEEMRAFMAELPAGRAAVLKALAGGGGRGIRIARAPEDLAEAFERCASEAAAAFGSGDLYIEQLLPRARHIEVQVIADAAGGYTHLWERECSLQRRHQKLVEVAPSPTLDPGLRTRLLNAALSLARAGEYRGLGTFEFLVDASAAPDGPEAFAFMEANPRLQVEHTVTEEVTGVDLVQAQLRIAQGATLFDLGLDPSTPPKARGHAVQVRVNLERMLPDGQTQPTGGTLRAFDAPTGPGLRVETLAYTGYTPSASFDSLLAKLVAWSPSARFEDALRRALRALRELNVDGIETNRGFLERLLSHPRVAEHDVYTTFVSDHLPDLVGDSAAPSPRLHFSGSASLDGSATQPPGGEGVASGGADLSPGRHGIESPMQGTIVSVDVRPGDRVRAGQPVVVLEAMKMEHLIEAAGPGRVREMLVEAAETVRAGQRLLVLEDADPVAEAADEARGPVDLDHVRPDLAELRARRAYGLDENRPEAVAKRRKTGHRTARENLSDLCDPGSFVEYGGLVIAAQRRRRELQELLERTPADGMIAGLGRVNGDTFDGAQAACAVLSYDYTVLAGTQGAQNHRKKDRLFEVVERLRVPVVFFTEGGGGRPGDTDSLAMAGLDCMAWYLFGKLSGLVPLVGITTGRCFAGNAALLGSCDVVIATRGANIGMGGPAMIEGGGLGVCSPEEVGPLSVQIENGVVDIAVEDEAEAVAVAKRYLSYFQGPLSTHTCADQRLLRSLIPENRKRIYDMRQVLATMMDEGSVLELRRGFAPGIITALARVEGRTLGVVANNPSHLAGAIDADGADKACRFMQLCDAFDVPILFLCDTPGIMVGPDAEATGLVRHAARMFVTSANLTVPCFTIVTRKGYGLGAMTMAGGSFKANVFTIAWPTGEFGGMGLEGAVRLAMRKELAAIEDPVKRNEAFEAMVAALYEQGKAVNAASHFEFDAVIDPVESRTWIATALRSAKTPRTGERRGDKKRPCIDPW